MASFMQNWWNKHDMDRDGKGCFAIVLVIGGALVSVGVGLGIIFAVAVSKLF